MQLCDWTNWQADRAELCAAAAHGIAATYRSSFCPTTPATQLTCARIYVANKCPAYPEPLWRGERYAHRAHPSGVPVCGLA